MAWADLIFTGGMLPQQADTLRLIELCREQGKPVVVGGPDATSSPHVYAAADFRALGEAEGLQKEGRRSYAFVMTRPGDQRFTMKTAQHFDATIAARASASEKGSGEDISKERMFPEPSDRKRLFAGILLQTGEPGLGPGPRHPK